MLTVRLLKTIVCWKSGITLPKGRFITVLPFKRVKSDNLFVYKFRRGDQNIEIILTKDSFEVIN